MESKVTVAINKKKKIIYILWLCSFKFTIWFFSSSYLIPEIFCKHSKEKKMRIRKYLMRNSVDKYSSDNRKRLHNTNHEDQVLVRSFSKQHYSLTTWEL